MTATVAAISIDRILFHSLSFAKPRPTWSARDKGNVRSSLYQQHHRLGHRCALEVPAQRGHLAEAKRHASLCRSTPRIPCRSNLHAELLKRFVNYCHAFTT